MVDHDNYESFKLFNVIAVITDAPAGKAFSVYSCMPTRLMGQETDF